jgi:xylose isomerase
MTKYRLTLSQNTQQPILHQSGYDHLTVNSACETFEEFREFLYALMAFKIIIHSNSFKFQIFGHPKQVGMFGTVDMVSNEKF